MMFSDKIEKTIGVKNDISKSFRKMSFVLAHEFGWSYDEIMEAPIPFVFDMKDELVEMKRKEKEAMRKRRH